MSYPVMSTDAQMYRKRASGDITRPTYESTPLWRLLQSPDVNNTRRGGHSMSDRSGVKKSRNCTRIIVPSVNVSKCNVKLFVRISVSV